MTITQGGSTPPKEGATIPLLPPPSPPPSDKGQSDDQRGDAHPGQIDLFPNPYPYLG